MNKQKLIELLPKEEIIKKSKEMSYQDLAKEYNTSRGTIWRILKENNAFKYKDQYLDNYKGVYTSIWACGRPMGKYRGRYPGGFLNRVANLINFDGKTVLHLFSGSIQQNQNHLTLDINSKVNPSFVADARKEIPLESKSVHVVMADPPYDSDFKIYGKRLYKTDEVRPYSFIKEATRVIKPEGYLCILHQLSYKKPEGFERKAVIGITTGPNMRIRVLNIFKKI